MHRLLVLPLLAILATPVWAQETSEPETEGVDSAETVDDAAEDAVEDEIDADDELYSEDDDDKFIPSEDVAFGQSVPFPTDI